MACMHDHSCEDHNCSADWSLYKHIDFSKVSALNESIAGSVKSVFKPWEHRVDTSEGLLESNDGDPELLVFIPFTSDVKIKSISVVGGAGGTSPSKMRAYSRFQSVASLTLHFPENFGGDTTQIYYIGLRGEATQLKRDVVATIVYEVMPNPSDHKTKADGGGGFSHVE
ncbi:PITH domain-containing protein 1 isoform X4 [Phoenix dactylifera]|uniref:PITH domain-containing protein 1 isoform X4 n=1 Tax=Phoenix dactylifera TaxID=42345 RepID=A0A8B9A3M8_PHODC|nr:PITH domain-containing protein 1 isoform X4 [Phoenix dactylifera]